MTDITPATMTRRQKAAVIVRLLLLHGVSPGIDKLSPAHQSVLARAMSGLGQIDRATLADIVGEFTGALDNLALIMPRGMHDALEILEPAYLGHGPRRAARGCRDRRRHRSLAPPRGDGYRATAPHPRRGKRRDLRDPAVQAFNVAKAAALLSDLPPDRAEVIAHAVSLTDTIPPETALRIGEHLHAQILAKPKATFDTGPWTASARC
jgi:flagellar motor switch protein FliG